MKLNNNNPNVHIVDDDEAIRDSLSMLLQAEGMNTTAYDSAQAFLKDYQTTDSGCIILDISMHGMTGLELQHILREEDIALPIIFITGHGDEIMHEQAMRAGAFDFIEKPFAVGRFLDRVKKAINYSQEQFAIKKLKA